MIMESHGIPSQLEPDDLLLSPTPKSGKKPRAARSLTAVCDLQSTPRATWHCVMASSSRPKLGILEHRNRNHDIKEASS